MKKYLIPLYLIICLIAYTIGYCTTTTTDNLELVIPAASDETVVWFDTVNDNFELIDDIFDDVTLTEFGYLDGVTSAIQDQLDAGTGGHTEEEIEDFVGGMLGGTETNISVDYQDTTNDIDFVVTLRTEEEIEDFVGSMLGGTETNITVTYEDATNDIDFVVTLRTQAEIEDWAGGLFTGNTETLITATYQVADNTLDLVVASAAVTDNDTTHVPTCDGVFEFCETTKNYALNSELHAERTDLTDFVDQTAWTVFYSNADGDVVELALGTDGKYLECNGVDAAPTWTTPAGSGDMLKATYDADADDEIDVAGGGTEKASWTQYCIPYLSNTTVFSEIPIGTAEYALTVAAGATGYDWTLFDLSLYYLKTAIDTQGEIETIWGDTLMNDLVDDTDPDLGGELDAGAHSIGFTLQTVAEADGTTTIDWKLGNHCKVTLGANAEEVFTFTAPTNPCNVNLLIIQDSVGSRDITWPGTVKWFGAEATWSNGGADKGILVGFKWDGTNYWGQATPWEL